MSIDWERLKRDGMAAYDAALKELERQIADLQAEQRRDARALYENCVYLDARRKDERAIRDEIDARLRVVEEQVTNVIARLTELAAPKCAVCHAQPATVGPDSKLCPDCLADVTAGIEDAGLAGLRVRRPAERNYPCGDRGSFIGTYCERCGTVIIHNAGEHALAACEYCGHTHLSAITQFRDDRQSWPNALSALRITPEAVTAARNGNGYVLTPGYPAEDGADD